MKRSAGGNSLGLPQILSAHVHNPVYANNLRHVSELTDFLACIRAFESPYRISFSGFCF